jgi:hypothetical protein
MSFATISLDALTDSLTESPETYDLALLSLVGDGTLGSPSSATVTIIDGTPPGGGGGNQPSGISVAPPGTLDEWQQFNLHVTVSPPGIYWVSGTVNWGNSPGMGSESFSVFTMGDGQFWLPHQYYDDGPSPGNGTPSDGSTITVTVGTLVGTAPVIVANVEPFGNGFHTVNTTPVGGPVWRIEGMLQDGMPGGDAIDVMIDWGDGSVPTELEGLPSSSSI